MSEKDNPHEETPIDPDTKVLLNLFQQLGSTSEGGDQETGLTGQNPSLDFTINLENLDITALQNLSTTVDDIPPEQMDMLLSLLKHINPEAQEANPQLDIQPSPVQTPQGNSNIVIDNPDHVTLENMPELSILSNLANLGDLTALDPETLTSLSTLIGADGSLNLDLKSLTTPQNAPLDLGLNTLGDLNLDAIVSLLNPNNNQLNQLDFQDPNLLTELSKSFNLGDLLIVPQDQNTNGNQQGLNMQENNQNSGQGQQRYANNSNSMNSMNNNKRRNGFPQQSVRRSPQRYKGRGYQQDYEDTINFNNNPMDQRVDQRGTWSNSNSNSNNFNNSRNMQFFNKRNYSNNSNNVSYDESNQYNNNNNRKRRCPDQNFNNNRFDPQTRHHSEPEKFLGVPLNELAYGSNSTSTNNLVTSFLERGDNYEHKNGKENHEEPEINISTSYYSDRLGLAEQYKNKGDTPVTKTLRRSIETADQRKNFIETSIKAFQERLHNAKRRFFEMQPNFDEELLNSRLEELAAMKRGEVKKSTIKKSIYKISPRKSKSKSKSVFEKLSGRDENPSVSPFGGLLDHLDSLTKLHRAQMLATAEVNTQITPEIIKKTVKDDLKATVDSHELLCIQKILNKESCLFRFPTTYSKSVVYQCATILSTPGIVVYVHSSSAYLIGQFQSLPSSLTGGYLGPLIPQDKMSENLKLTKDGQLKILFTTPDKFEAENLSEVLNIAFICLDEAHCVPELSSNYKASYSNFLRLLKRRHKSIPVLCFVPPITQSVCEDLTKIIHIADENIFPKEYVNTGAYDLTISRDDDKSKALLNILKSPKYKDRCHSMILYTENRKTAEDLISYLAINGYKASLFHSGKSDSQKFDMLVDITNNCEGIIVSTSNTEIGLDKNIISCVIHYSIPKSLEIYIQEVSCLNEKAVCHLFLHDEDYYAARINFRSEMVEKDQLKAFIEKILEVSTAKKVELKRLDNNKKIRETSNMSQSDMEEEEAVGLEEENIEMCSVRVDELCQETDMKKEMLIQIFRTFEELDDWLEFHDVTVMTCTLKILNGKGASLAMKHKLIQLMIDNTKKESGMYKFNVSDMATELNCTASDIVKLLKSLQNEGSINYEVIEEAFYYRILFNPNPIKIVEKIEDICQNIQKKGIMNIQKLDLMYAVARSSSFQTIEHLSKQNKFDNDKLLRSITNTFGKEASSSSTSMSFGDRDQGSSEKKKGKINLIEFFEKYLNYREDFYQGYDHIWDGPIRIWDIIPITKVQTQREKSSILVDATPLINELFDEMNISESYNILQEPKSWDLINAKAKLSRSVVKIMQGLQLFWSRKDWKSHRCWAKYYKYDYWELYDVVSEIVGNLISNKNLRKTK